MQPDAEMFDRLRKVEMSQGTHEAVCAERYNGILNTHSDIKREMHSINKLIRGVGFSLLGGMALILVHQLFYK
jgi:hypothetical protein